MADVTIRVKSGETIINGSVVTMSCPIIPYYLSVSPKIAEHGVVVPSGVFGRTDDGYLADRYNKPSGGYTG